MLRPFVSRSQLLFFSFLLVASPGCSGERAPRSTSTNAPYAFERPSATYELPEELEEISGLTRVSENLLAAIQDEDGIIFFIDAENGEVLQQVEFEGPGDYEGIEAVGEDVFVMNSGGTLFRVSGWEGSSLQSERIETPLDARCDAEGLGYDHSRDRLLLACKEDPGRDVEDGRAIYGYDVGASVFEPEPAYVLDFRARGSGRGGSEDNLGELVEEFHNLPGNGVDATALKPSAVAAHPVTGEVYVLSSAGPEMVVLDNNGEPRDVWALPRDQLPQPEGLAFLENGDLFISTEKRGRRPGRIYRYTYRPRGVHTE